MSQDPPGNELLAFAHSLNPDWALRSPEFARSLIRAANTARQGGPEPSAFLEAAKQIIASRKNSTA